MKLTDNLGKLLSNGFLICIILFGATLTYMSVKAQKVAEKWATTNDEALQELMK